MANTPLPVKVWEITISIDRARRPDGWFVGVGRATRWLLSMPHQADHHRCTVLVAVVAFLVVVCSCSREEPAVSPERELSKHEVMRLAEDVSAGRRDESELAKHEIKLGEWVEIDKEELLRQDEFRGDSDDQQVFIVLFRDDFPYDDRSEVEDALVESLAKDGVGEWSGAGTDLGERTSLHISFKITNRDKALSVIRKVLREKRVGKSTEIWLGEGTYSVYDD